MGLCATAVSIVVGVTYGALAGYTGGRTDAVMMRAVDTLYALPLSMLVIVLLVVFKNSLFLLFLAIGLVEWLTMARIVRGQVLSLRERPFTKAARVLGYSPARIIAQHIVPNVWPAVSSQFGTPGSRCATTTRTLPSARTVAVFWFTWMWW